MTSRPSQITWQIRCLPRYPRGSGNGGQRLFVMPVTDLAAALFFGAYNRPDQWVAPIRIWRETVLANL